MAKIEKSIQLKQELDKLRPIKKEDELRIMQKFRLDWNYHSNNLEGNSLTYGETKALILFGITAQGKPLKDHFEITGHDKAIKWVIDIVKEERPITESFIRELHKLILKDSYEVNAITPEGKPTTKKVKVGEYKSTPNHVKTKTGEIFRFATPEETPALMHDLIEWYREKSKTKEVNPILLAAEFHYKYIRIHPFDDGNGRTARILMNFILMRFGYPPVIIETTDKQNYFAVLRQADAGVLTSFVEYVSDNLNRSLELMIRGAKGQKIEERDDLDKEIALLEQKLNTVGSSVKILKSIDRVLEIYDDSISKTTEIFIEKGKLFEKFYLKNDFTILFFDETPFYLGDFTILKGRDKITNDISSVQIQFDYDTFNRVGFEEFNYKSQFVFFFEETQYKVKNNAGFSIYKLYREQLTEDEIVELVISESKKHKALIEQKIEEFKNSQD